jgi:hypothetical protein
MKLPKATLLLLSLFTLPLIPAFPLPWPSRNIEISYIKKSDYALAAPHTSPSKRDAEDVVSISPAEPEGVGQGGPNTVTSAEGGGGDDGLTTDSAIQTSGRKHKRNPALGAQNPAAVGESNDSAPEGTPYKRHSQAWNEKRLDADGEYVELQKRGVCATCLKKAYANGEEEGHVDGDTQGNSGGPWLAPKRTNEKERRDLETYGIIATDTKLGESDVESDMERANRIKVRVRAGQGGY